MKIVAIGGGDIGAGETFPLDRRAVELTGKSNPRALFLPTASFDSPGYYEVFQQVYEGRLGCSSDHLFLWEGYTGDEIEHTIQATKWNTFPHRWEFRGDLSRVGDLIAECDLIYVGGGNTRRMIELWRSVGADQMIRDAAERGAVLTGVSAGCICWARFGNSDAALTEGLGRPTMRIDCLDFIPISLCPHMSREGVRLVDFTEMMRNTPGVGIGLDDGCALEVVDDRYRIIASIEGAVAHRITSDSYTVLEPMEEPREFSDLH